MILLFCTQNLILKENLYLLLQYPLLFSAFHHFPKFVRIWGSGEMGK